MKTAHPLSFRIRDLNPGSQSEIELVAQRMRETLIEVLGEEKGTSLYSWDWLLNRVRWHLDPTLTTSKVLLIEDTKSQILGHAIARLERDKNENPFGYFSTIFIEPRSRNLGLATALILQVESWFREIKMSKIVYNTAENHSKLIRLLKRHGYQITLTTSEMVQLTKNLS